MVELEPRTGQRTGHTSKLCSNKTQKICVMLVLGVNVELTTKIRTPLMHNSTLLLCKAGRDYCLKREDTTVESWKLVLYIVEKDIMSRTNLGY